MTAQAEEVKYNAFTGEFAGILEKLGCEHKDTVDNVEQWEKRKDDGFTEISVDYISGVVIVKKFTTPYRFLGKKTFTLTGKDTMEAAARAAVNV